MPKEITERRVKPQDVTAVVNGAHDEGWQLINTSQEAEGNLLLIFEREVESQAVSHPPRSKAKPNSNVWTNISAPNCLVLILGICLVGFIILWVANTSEDTQQSAFDQDTLLTLIKATMQTTGYPINTIEVRSSTLMVTAEAARSDTLEYRMGIIGALTGAATAAYKDEQVTPPVRVRIDFISGTATVLRISFTLADAQHFMNKEISDVEFINTWNVTSE